MKRYLYSIIRTFLQGGIPIAISFVIGNFLPPSIYGQYVALLLLSTTVAILVAMPVDSAAIHYILKSPSSAEQNKFYSAGVCVVMVNAFLVAAVLFCGRSYFMAWFRLDTVSPNLYNTIVVLGAGNVVYSFFAKMMTVRFLFKEQIVILLVSAAIQSLLIVGLVLSKTKLLVGFVVAALLFLFAGILLSERRLQREFSYDLRVGFSSHVGPLLKFGSFIYLGALAGFFDEKIDLICINNLLDKEQVAFYSYAMLFGFAIYGLGIGVSQVTFLLFCGYFRDDDMDSCALVYKRVVNYLFIVISFIGLVLIYHSRFIINLLLPAEYMAMLPALTIIVIGIILFAVFAGVGALLTAAGKPQYGLWLLSSFMVVNLILNLLLIPRWGIVGAAVATASTFTARALAGHWLNRKITGVSCSMFKLLFWFMVILLLVAFGSDRSELVKLLLLFSFLSVSCWSILDRSDFALLRSLAEKATNKKYNSL